MLLLNPKKHSRKYEDKETREIMLATIDFFEKKGKGRLKREYHERVWYADFIEFIKENKIFARLLTPTKYGDGTSQYRWDTSRNCEFNEILGFYGLLFWYTWQVSILGLGPIWISKNEDVKKKTARLLNEGGIFGFGLSEKDHGADIYSTEMALVPRENGGYLAKGRKYYIGNGNEAALVSTLGKIKKPGETEKDIYSNFVFFVVGSKHGKYECVKNVIDGQAYVAEYALNDYPIEEADILSKGRDAWDMALNTVNIGKYNLGWCSIGMCTHALYETLNHAGNRVLYGKHVTDFSHVRNLLVESYIRIVSMKIFSLRANDYIRTATLKDRRYLLYTPMVKMKVTMQGELVMDTLMDVISARGFEKDTYFEMAAKWIRGLPRLEGTVHVNMALVVKFMQNYFFNHEVFPEVPRVEGIASDDFLFDQGTTSGLSSIRFHDYKIAFDAFDLPNVDIFKKQIEALKEFIIASASDMARFSEQSKDIDFLFALGEIFSVVVYGQLILEYAMLDPSEATNDLIDQIFDVLIRDYSRNATILYGKESTSDKQMDACLKMIIKPAVDPERRSRIWNEHVIALKDVYSMNE